MGEKTYIAIDLKSFYASCEAVSRGYDPMDVNLVVADKSRTSKTICLAVSPSLKSFGIPGRARLYEVEAVVKKVNEERLSKCKNFAGKSILLSQLKRNPNLELDFVIASPRMKKYTEISAFIYKEIYLKYISENDIFAYSVDEVFMNVTSYLRHYNISAIDFVRKILKEILDKTGLTATAGIGTNMFLAKVAMDVMAKKVNADKYGNRIAILDTQSFRKNLWSHTPITDFWMIGKGTAKRLEYYGIRTLGDLSLFSLKNENVLYKEFGVNAEYLIDHAWGWEPCEISDVKSYISKTKSLTTSQVLSCGYKKSDAKIILEEMIEDLVLDMNYQDFYCNTISLRIDYDMQSISDETYTGECTKDYYGRVVPKPFSMQKRLSKYEFSIRVIKKEFLGLFNLVDSNLLIKRLTISLDNLEISRIVRQMMNYSLFNMQTDEELKKEINEQKLNKEINIMKKKYGKNIFLKASSYLDKATARDRNKQIGGHKA